MSPSLNGFWVNLYSTFNYRHHIHELVLTAAFGVCMGPSKGPEILIFKQFQAQWASIDQKSYQDASSDDMGSHRRTELCNLKDEMIDFCEQQQLDHQPPDDYCELLKRVLIFLGRKPSNWKNIYSIKFWLFQAFVT